MSEVAGRMSIQAGAYFLEKAHGGLGVLLGGVPGVDPPKVVILGGGVVGTHAAHIALGMGPRSGCSTQRRCAEASVRQFGRPLNTVFSTRGRWRSIAHRRSRRRGVLIPGCRRAEARRRQLVSEMKPGSVIVDVAIDQGGCFETSHGDDA